ncbi:hypothetical protein H0H81_004692 [Sphagnurus paluster]|uniref:Uncharacterized protein n=1 Tax=Sphagnurus paluster TaxID=117069 RepID=A0A9P7GHF0_9AGAR|nr:hypothetical protein H0H81_004692 [Sphagnurus paluster]
MPEKDKNRLWIYLQHRNGAPGHHWSLVLTPKNIDHGDTYTNNVFRFHVTNSITVRGNTPGTIHYGNPPWRFECRSSNALRSGSIIGRVLVAKLSATVSLAEQSNYIEGIVRPGGSGGVPVVQNHPSWNCVSWVQSALAALKMAGGELGSIPDIFPGGSHEREICKFADKCMDKFLGQGGQEISSLPFLDLRGK